MPRKRAKRQNRARGWGSVGQRPGGDWYAQYPSRMDPKRHTTYGFATADEAHDWLDAEVKAWIGGTERRADRPFGQYLDQWLARHEPFLSAQTIPAYRRAVAYMEPIKAVALDTLTHEHLGDVWAALRTRGLALTTIRAARTVISAALNDAVPHLIPENPNRRARVPKPQLDVACWSEAERNAFLRLASESDWYALWLLALLHGPRMAGEVRGLQWRDVNWDDGTLTFERSLYDVGAVEGPTKQRRSRAIVLSAPVLAALRALHDRSPRRTPWIFAGGPDGLPWSRRSMWREFTRIRKAAKLPQIRLYDCRHTAATTALRRGVPLTEVSYMLGHAKVSVTLDYYARWLPSGQRDAARLIGESLPPGLHPGKSGESVTQRAAMLSD